MSDLPISEPAAQPLLASFPLAWVVSATPEMQASLLPLRLVMDAGGKPVAIRGHFARSNLQVAALRGNPRATILALGPHGYISPSWLSDRTQAPSWNYAAERFVVDVSFIETPEFTAGLLRDQVDAMERGRPGAWSIAEMGPRYELLAQHVIGFEARILQSARLYKLGQADRNDVLAESIRALAGDALADWMSAANPGRA